MDNDEAVTHTTPSGALTLIGHSSRKICVYENPQAILILFFFFKAKSEKDARGGALGLSFGYAEPLARQY